MTGRRDGGRDERYGARRDRTGTNTGNYTNLGSVRQDRTTTGYTNTNANNRTYGNNSRF